MNQTEKKNDWLRFIKASQSTYKLNALKAVFENDGLAMLKACLADLGWEQSVDLILQVESPRPIDTAPVNR